jgi:hypothetical protein
VAIVQRHSYSAQTIIETTPGNHSTTRLHTAKSITRHSKRRALDVTRKVVEPWCGGVFKMDKVGSFFFFWCTPLVGPRPSERTWGTLTYPSKGGSWLTTRDVTSLSRSNRNSTRYPRRRSCFSPGNPIFWSVFVGFRRFLLSCRRPPTTRKTHPARTRKMTSDLRSRNSTVGNRSPIFRRSRRLNIWVTSFFAWSKEEKKRSPTHGEETIESTHQNHGRTRRVPKEKEK